MWCNTHITRVSHNLYFYFIANIKFDHNTIAVGIDALQSCMCNTHTNGHKLYKPYILYAL